MSLSDLQSNGIDVRTECLGPHLFGAADYRSWIEEEIRHAVKAVLEEVLDAEIAAHLGAAPGERTEGRTGYRNGSYTRGLKSRVGALEITVPRDRDGSFRPGVFERYSRMESPLEEALLRAYLEGVSTRRGGDIAEALAGEGISMETIDGWSEPHREFTMYPGVDRPHSIRQYAPWTGSATYYYATDHPGNVLGLFNASNQVVSQYRYDPWGTVQWQSDPTFNTLRYAGRYYDWDTGLYHNRNRWYDSHVGRFISEDPLGLEGGINPYAYAANNPVDLTDPFGLDPCTVSQAQTTACAIPLPGVVVVVSRGFRLPGWLGAVVGFGAQWVVSQWAAGGGWEGAVDRFWNGSPDECGKPTAPETGCLLVGIMPSGLTPGGTGVATKALVATHSVSGKAVQKLTADVAKNGMKESIKYVEHNGIKYVVDGNHRLRVARRLVGQLTCSTPLLKYGRARA
jgi:RHS repeat-associated protein